MYEGHCFRPLKGTVAREFFKLKLCGFRLGHTDVTHPLLTSVHCPFDLLRTFKEGVHRSKTDFIILSDTHALCNVHACLRPTETSFFTKEQIYACVSETYGSIVKKCAKTIFAVFKGFSEMHAC